MPIKVDTENMLCPGSEYSPGRGSLSAPGSRSNSWKTRHRNSLHREKRASNLTRTNSQSTPDCSDTQILKRKTIISSSKDCPLCTVLSFTTTSKGIINSGSFNKSLSSNSLFSSGSLAVTGGGSCTNFPIRSTSVDRIQKGCESGDRSEGSINASSALTVSYFRTAVLGAPGVGKSSLVRHLTRSTSLSSCQDDETSRPVSVDPMVTVELDGQESTMEFIDGPEISDLEQYRADAFIIMYAVSEIQSYIAAISLLNHLRQDLGTDRPIYVVANKTDLVRQRLVSIQDVKNSLSSLDCHFLEISTALNVNLDQLLVGVLCKIKEQLTPLPYLDLDPIALASLRRKRRSSPGALAAISNFLKHACKRENRGRNSAPVLQVV